MALLAPHACVGAPTPGGHARALLFALALAAATGCTARATNTATVFPPITGVVQMEIKLPAGEAVDKVQFQVNDKVVQEDDDPTDGYKAEIDTANLEPQVLAKIAAVGVRANGSTVVLRENFILVGSPPSAAEDANDPEPTASADATDNTGTGGGDDAVGGDTAGG